MVADLDQREEIEPRDLDALLRRLDRRRHHLRERQAAEHRMGVAASRHRPRRRDGEDSALGAIAHGAGMAVVRRRARAVRLEHVGGRRERGARVGIEAQETTMGGGVDRDAGIAAESAHRRLDHERGERGADQRVDRVSAFLHEAYPGVGHRRVSAGAYAALRFDRRAGVDGFAASGTGCHADALSPPPQCAGATIPGPPPRASGAPRAHRVRGPAAVSLQGSFMIFLGMTVVDVRPAQPPSPSTSAIPMPDSPPPQ